MKKYLSIALRILVAAAGIAFIVLSLTWHSQVILPVGFVSGNIHVTNKPLHVRVVEENKTSLKLHAPNGEALILKRSELGSKANEPRFRPSIGETLADADYLLAFFGLLLCGVVFPLQGLRWLFLLRGRKLIVSYNKALRLTMVGQFFNFCMPGTTGGDVMKAYYAAKNSGQRGAAVMSVLFDRIAGLLGMLILGAVVGLALLSDPTVEVLMLICWAALLVLVLIASVYFSRTLRRLLFLDWLLSHLPKDGIVGKLQDLANAFANNPGAVCAAVVISLPTQVALMTCVAFAGQAMGMAHPLWVLVATLPVIFIAGAVPITYQGLGVMEGLGIALLVAPGMATANQVVAMFLLYRLFMIFYALIGSLVLVRGDIHLFPETQTQTGTRDRAARNSNLT